MTVALNRDYFENGKLGGIYDETYFTAGTPIIVSKDNGQVAIGAVFISTPSASMYYFAEEIVRIFIMAAITTFAVMFCVVGFFTYSMVKPLRQMSEAAKNSARAISPAEFPSPQATKSVSSPVNLTTWRILSPFPRERGAAS